MNNKYKVRFSKNFKRNMKKEIKKGKNIDKLLDIVDKLVLKESLEEKYKCHKLYDNKVYKNCYECHIEPDWLLIYTYIEKDTILLLINVGSHSEVF